MRGNARTTVGWKVENFLSGDLCQGDTTHIVCVVRLCIMRRRPSSSQIITPFSHDWHWSLIYEYKTHENVFKRRIPKIVSEPPPSWLKSTRENMAALKTATRAPGFSRICACRAWPRDTVCARSLQIGVPPQIKFRIDSSSEDKIFSVIIFVSYTILSIQNGIRQQCSCWWK